MHRVGSLSTRVFETRTATGSELFTVFSRDVTVAMLVFPNNGTAAILGYPTNPPGIELYYHANVFFCFGVKTRLLIT